MMHGAIYDAANSVGCAWNAKLQGIGCNAEPYLVQVEMREDLDPVLETAIDYAAVTVLRSTFPQLDFDADLAGAQQGRSQAANEVESARAGTAAARAMIDARAGDGSTNNTAYVHGTAPGDWRPTGSGPAATPNWGLVTPFALTSGAQVRPPLPGGFASTAALLASPLYAAQVNEVKELGREDSSTRTAEQTEIAWFWANDLDGTYKPPGQHFAHTQIVARQQQLDQTRNARLFALVAISMADAGIAAWDAKYRTPVDLWRPETAIQLAGTDGNSATTADPNWKPLSADRDGNNFSPAFPAYISGHATFGAAWAGAMRNYFGTDAMTFTATTEDPHAVGVTRTFTSFSAAATEDARSRIYLGVHYQFDADQGLATGTAVADHAAANHLQAAPEFDFIGPFTFEQDCRADGDARVATSDYYEFFCDGFLGEWFLYIR
ncbi:phosphatase PAP2 family protein [Micromonospora radicis]|uniref:Phosphatase PAP2 family protein n=2 Tax=Micromonospora radicis TaxID=1894971 RepID=A0A418N1X7_9ACTN|nr:phosphatase PAP2 family protein [Micromonospora radicis]